MLLVSGATRTVRDVAARAPTMPLGALIVPGSGNKVSSLPWAADNGAFSGFDEPAFRKMLTRLAGTPGCLFVTAPDVVADAPRTLSLFDVWEPIIRSHSLPVALVAQDGLTSAAVPWDRLDALFIGGSTDWKLGSQAHELVREAKARGKWVHMGRVNTRRRIKLCVAWGVDSIDGTQWSRWADTHLHRGLRAIVREEAQGRLFQ